MTTPDELRDRIVARLRASGVWWADDTEGPADAVMADVREAVADELDAAADEDPHMPGAKLIVRQQLRARAARWRGER